MHAKRNSAIFHLLEEPFITQTVRTLRLLPREGRANLKKSHLSRTVWKLIPFVFCEYMQKRILCRYILYSTKKFDRLLVSSSEVMQETIRFL